MNGRSYPNMPTVADVERYAVEKAARLVTIAQSCSDMGPRFARRTFETFEATKGSSEALVAARKAAANCTGLGLYGAAGLGKSHLAAAIVNEFTARGVGAIYTGVVEMLAKIKAAFDTHGNEGIVARLCDMPMLVLDDLGKEQLTEWSASTLYRIVNRRYENDLPLIVTCNRSLADLSVMQVGRAADRRVDEHVVVATIDRIAEMTGVWIGVHGESWRMREHVARSAADTARAAKQRKAWAEGSRAAAEIASAAHDIVAEKRAAWGANR